MSPHDALPGCFNCAWNKISQILDIAAPQNPEQTKLAARARLAAKPYSLTSTEISVLELIARGRLNNEIAIELGSRKAKGRPLSIRTIQSHEQNLHSKLCLQTRAKLVVFAFKLGLVIPYEIDLEGC